MYVIVFVAIVPAALFNVEYAEVNAPATQAVLGSVNVAAATPLSTMSIISSMLAPTKVTEPADPAVSVY